MDLSDKLCPWLLSDLDTLEQAFKADRLGHGWIFTGAAGTGKFNLALVFASRLLSSSGVNAPDTFQPEEIVAAGEAMLVPRNHHPDLHVIQPDEGKRSIGIDRIRDVMETVSLTAYSGRAKLVIITPAEMMTSQAANALLKSLEEPSRGTHLLLLSHRIGRLPATVRSRCQTLRLRQPSSSEISKWLGATGSSDANLLIDADTVGPILAAERLLSGNMSKYNVLYSTLNDIYEDKIAATDAVDTCKELEPSLVLEWIAARIHQIVRWRTASDVRNSITDRKAPMRHNNWDLLSTLRLFELLTQVEQLRDVLGTGINEQLGMQVLLGRFSQKA
jgi:DNA polymerase-3 subunit delta'